MKPKNRIVILLSFFIISLNLYSQEVSKYSIFKHTTYGYFEITDNNLNEVLETFELYIDSISESDLVLDSLEIHFNRTEGKYSLINKSSREILKTYKFKPGKIYQTTSINDGKNTADFVYFEKDKKKPHDKLSYCHIYGVPIASFHFLEKVGDKWLSYSYDCVLMKEHP